MKLQDILARLKEPIPQQLVSTRKQGGANIKYVNWAELCDLLDSRAGLGAWSFDIREIRETSALSTAAKKDGDGNPFNKVYGAQLIILGTLTIYGDDESRTYTAAGIEKLDCGSFGDPTSNASAMSLRRCCALAGLGRSLWKK